jgi:serine/threonine protein kinase
VYKARKRLGIEFVALRKVDKSRQPKLLNEVRALGELRHGNVLAFHGWYYTERHLWVVTEYCAGGDLAALIAHDRQLPEPTVVSFGLDALAALQHVHGCGFLAVDLTPRAFLLNESGAARPSDSCGFTVSVSCATAYELLVLRPGWPRRWGLAAAVCAPSLFFLYFCMRPAGYSAL